MTALSSFGYLPTPQFEKFVINSEKDLPRKIDGSLIDLRGSVAITINNNPWYKRSLLHNIIILFQKIHAFFMKRSNINHKYLHGMVITNKIDNESVLKTAHSAMTDGVHLSNFNTKKKKASWTSVVIYRPIDYNLREVFASYAEQTAFPHKKVENGLPTHKKRPFFSTFDLMGSFFRSGNMSFNDKRIQKRIASITADLLLNQQFNKKSAKLKSYFCMAYVMSVFQGARIVTAMDQPLVNSILFDDEKLRSRKDIIQKIYSLIHDKSLNNNLAKFFWNDPLCQFNARYLMSYQAGNLLDKFSQPLVHL
jgi:hypothetical protein